MTLLEANHCPGLLWIAVFPVLFVFSRYLHLGAVLLLFQLKNNSRILHTGDFRADTDVQKNTFILGKYLHKIISDGQRNRVG